MNRRDFVAAAAGLLSSFPLAAQPSRPRIVWLGGVTRAAGGTFLTPFLEGMAAYGYQVGRNYELDERWAENSLETAEKLAVDAAALKPALFVTQGTALHAVRKLPGAIPVVFGNSGDPIDTGVAKTLARPGGHFTGITFLSYALVGKRVELLREVAPQAKRLAVVSNTNHRGDAKEFAATRDAAIGVGFEVSHYPATNPAELERAFAAVAAARADAAVVHPDALMVQQRAAIGRFSVEHRIPTISGWATIAEGGSLLSYGPLLQECYRRLAYFVDRILRGAKPADLPIEFPNKVELVVNLKTAKALGLAIPATVLVRADRVIQ